MHAEELAPAASLPIGTDEAALLPKVRERSSQAGQIMHRRGAQGGSADSEVSRQSGVRFTPPGGMAGGAGASNAAGSTHGVLMTTHSL